jgi:DNA polymerase
VMVTYHPAALLRFPDYKKDTWEDVQRLKAAFDATEGEPGGRG